MMPDKKVIVTGAAGYIGGQTVLQLRDSGHYVIGIDYRPLPPHLEGQIDEFYQEDFASNVGIITILNSGADAIIHCAGTSLVGPSLQDPGTYYDNNFVKTKRLVDHMVAHNRQNMRFIFSSSAATYGDPVMTPCNEEDPCLPISPYGESKLMVEMLLQSYFRAHGIQPVMFRYFNACGADSQARHGQEAGATHIIARVLESIRDNQGFVLFGDRYQTSDGTCVRDYIHVEDIARAHIAAINHTIPTGIYNLGSSQGYSNREIINTAESVTGKKCSVTLGDPRPGDPAVLTANPNRFNSVVNDWKQHDLHDMVSHAWSWYNKNDKS